jgi:hypothetical protein
MLETTVGPVTVGNARGYPDRATRLKDRRPEVLSEPSPR